MHRVRAVVALGLVDVVWWSRCARARGARQAPAALATAAGFFFARGVNLGRAAAVWWCFGSLPLAPDDDCSGLTQAKKKAKGFPNYNFYIVETHTYS